jgi:hypothetical protein
MDTVSSPVSRHAHVVRLSALLALLAFVVLSLLVGVGAILDDALRASPADELLAPFRWIPTRHGLA